MKPIEVENGLRMRLIAEEDADEIHALVLSNLERLHEWMQWAVLDYKREMTAKFAADSQNKFAKGEAINLAMEYEGRIAGGIGLNFLDDVNKGTEIGYWIGEEFEGRGLVTKCCTALIGHAFKELGMRRIVIRCAPTNARSRAIPERLGFTIEGTLREAEYLHGRFEDLVIYSMLASEWEDKDH